MSDVASEKLSLIENEQDLRALHHAPMSRATDKVLTRLDVHCRNIITASPFCILSTQGPDGADVSPRGDPPGFVRILDNKTLLLPDRVGNNRFDAYVNILSNPSLGLLFLVPGMNETLRVNGTGKITNDERLLAASAVHNRAPKVGLIISINEAFLHCAKALARAKLWDSTAHIERNQFPSYPAMLKDHVEGLTDEENERQSKVMAERGLY